MQNHSPAVDRVVRLFEDWRASRSGKRSIPEALLDEAFEVRHETSLNRLARMLRLNHTRLAQAFEERLGRGAKATQQSQPPARQAKGSVPTSAEVHVTRVVELAQGHGSTCAEVKSPSGWLLRLSASAPAGVIDAVVGALWEREVVR